MLINSLKVSLLAVLIVQQKILYYFPTRRTSGIGVIFICKCVLQNINLSDECSNRLICLPTSSIRWRRNIWCLSIQLVVTHTFMETQDFKMIRPTTTSLHKMLLFIYLELTGSSFLSDEFCTKGVLVTTAINSQALVGWIVRG